MKGDAETGFNPNAVQIRNAAGTTVIPTQLSKHDLSGTNESLVLAQLPVGNYQIWISGQNNTKGAFAMSVYLAGDANGDHIVDQADAELTRSVYGSKAGELLYLPSERELVSAQQHGDGLAVGGLVEDHGGGVAQGRGLAAVDYVDGAVRVGAVVVERDGQFAF